MYKRGMLYFKAFSIITILLAATFYVSLLSVDVRAINVCCEKTIADDYCQYTDEANCDQSVRQVNAVASCEWTSYCQLGCCYGLENTGCSRSTSKATCEAKNGIFSTDASCNSINECKQVCCQIGNECQLATQDSCQALGSSLGIRPTIRDVANEQQCISYCRLEETGCCTLPGTCSYLKSSECSSLSGSFNPGKYCSSLDSCKSCKKQSYKACIEGKDDVFWFDSCGNQEGIAQECDYLSGTTCGEVSGDIQCRNVDCPNTNKGNKKNGESWCIVEGSSDLGLPSVGSRYYRAQCVNGEEIVESCRDFREEFCVQGTINIAGKQYTEASCIKNDWEPCVNSCNTGNLEEDKKCCENKDFDCRWTGNSCIPLVPPGSRFWQEENDKICDTADASIKVYYQKKSFADDWDCAGNCFFMGKDPTTFLTNYNAYCTSFGDCGANYNYIGNFSSQGYTCKSSEGSCRGSFKGDRYDISQIKQSFLGNFDKSGRKVLLDIGNAGLDNSLAGSIVSTGTLAIAIFLYASQAIIGTSIATVLGVQAGLVATQLGWIPIVGWIILGVVAFAYIISITGKSDDITFNLSCEPWQAPAGGKYCYECDKNPSLPCTEYKCKSLGQNCEYIAENEGSSRPTCYNINPNDINSPIISPLKFNLSIREDINGYTILQQVPANKKLNFGIKTDELAQCKYDTSQDIKLEDMTDSFGTSFYSINHNLTINPLSGKAYKYFIRCRDKSGNANQRDYLISFSSSRGPDLTAPVIEYTIPKNNGFVANGIVNLTSDLYLNEAADCRWSSVDKAYESMTSDFNCLKSEDPATSLYRCQDFLPFNQPSSTYYIRCKDNSTNINSQSYVYNLKGTEQLTIASKKPEGKLLFKNQTIEVTTAGGAESGISTCRFSAEDIPYNAMIDFFATNSTRHMQQLALDQGKYIYTVKCRDIAKNEAATKLVFTVEIDNNPPRITRLFKDSSSVNLILNEPAICEYDGKPFTFGSGINMPVDNSITHTAPLKSNYYIECKDQSGNTLGQIKVFP